MARRYENQLRSLESPASHEDLQIAVVKINFLETIIEMWNIMLAAPSNLLPSHNVERILMTFCLMANLIIIGTFQGTLTTSFSTVTYYKDSNTLEEVDATGLPILVGSKCV